MRTQGLLGTTILCGLLSSTAVQAQVSGADVWQGWKDMATSSGQAVTTLSEEQSGDTLVIKGMTFTSTDPEVTVTGTLDEVRFRDVGDGTVEVTMSPSYPLTIESKNEEGQPVKVDLALTQTNLKMLVGGSGDQMTYDFTTDAIAIATTGVTEAGAALPVSVNVVANGAGGRYVMTKTAADVMDLESTFNAGDIKVSVAARDDEQQSDLTLDASVGQFAAVTNGTFGAMLEMAQLSDALKAGFATDVAFTFGPLAYTMNVVDVQGPTAIRGKSDGGSFGLVMDKSKIAYKGGGKGVEAIISSSQIPFPEVAIRYAESVVDFLMPVSAGPEPQAFGLTTKLIDLTVSDEVWGLFDPMATLPRDPATLIVETTGTATLDVDIMNETAMAAQGDVPPGKLMSFDLKALQLKIAGADLTGNGALTFDNSDLTTFPGMPAPTGRVDLMLVGGNALLDKLIALGYVPEDQAMSVRMMMGMFARPGTAPDTLTSTLEFRDKGFFANGMQLQ